MKITEREQRYLYQLVILDLKMRETLYIGEEWVWRKNLRDKLLKGGNK